MLTSQKVIDAINEQIGYEFSAELQYYEIGAHFASDALPQLSQHFFQQAEEEKGHALRFIKYVVDAGGRVPEGFRAQATQVFENLKIALASAGAGFEHVVKINSYLTDIPAQIPILREVRETYLNKAAPPASTTVQVVALADPRYLIEVEATAILPQRG